MQDIAHSAQDMIAGMTPALQSGAYVFASFPDSADASEFLTHAIGSFREAEGLSLLLPQAIAQAGGLDSDLPMHCITLNVYSSLEGVGLTAAVATALGAHNIPCNMVAAFHHDHVFVPASQSAQAMQILLDLQTRG